MAEKIVIDPVTRIEGHLSITVEVENGVVKDAWSAGTMFRGFEVLLQGKDPRDAVYVTDRVCGVCTGSHGWASALALDEAFGATVPEAGVLMRNLMMGAIWLHDHPLHFYHLSALDYIDVTAVAQYKGNDPKLNAVKDKIVALVQAGDAHPLVPRYQPDEFSVKDPELVTTAVYHYLFALDMQAKAKRMAALLGGKIPHNSAMVVGGFTNFPSVETLNNYRSLLLEQIDFLENVYLKDVLIFGTGPLLPLAQAGIGGGYGNFMAYGGFHDDVEKKNLFFKPGVIVNGNIDQVLEFTPDKITEKFSARDPIKGPLFVI
ncbi:Nickel-dependent hydrogenase [Carboxydocella thermautotrophica]|nr:Nickel-dependent hydrogenase [Carboxydocella thermautotrophica]